MDTKRHADCGRRLDDGQGYQQLLESAEKQRVVNAQELSAAMLRQSQLQVSVPAKSGGQKMKERGLGDRVGGWEGGGKGGQQDKEWFVMVE